MVLKSKPRQTIGKGGGGGVGERDRERERKRENVNALDSNLLLSYISYFNQFDFPTSKKR
jgi:hypothetical protein